MSRPQRESAIDTVRDTAHPLVGAPQDFDPLLDLVGDARFVLLGEARLPHQFDAVLHYDVTRAVEPLERTGRWERGEVPETFPTALQATSWRPPSASAARRSGRPPPRRCP
jgi:hypothetical protein